MMRRHRTALFAVYAYKVRGDDCYLLNCQLSCPRLPIWRKVLVRFNRFAELRSFMFCP